MTCRSGFAATTTGKGRHQGREAGVPDAPFEGTVPSSSLSTRAVRRFRRQFRPLGRSLVGNSVSSATRWPARAWEHIGEGEVHIAAHTSAWITWHEQGCLFVHRSQRFRRTITTSQTSMGIPESAATREKLRFSNNSSTLASGCTKPTLGRERKEMPMPHCLQLSALHHLGKDPKGVHYA